jgi:WD40 repeat protein
MSEIIQTPPILESCGHIEVPQCPQFFISDVVFSPRQNMISVASWDKTVRLLDIHKQSVNGRVIYRHEGAVHTTHFSADGTKLVSGSADGTAMIFDMQMLKTQLVIKNDSFIQTARFVRYANAREVLATIGLDKTLKFWDLDSKYPKIIRSNYGRARSYKEYHAIGDTNLDGHKGRSYGYCNGRRKRCYLRSNEPDASQARYTAVRR